MSSYLGRHAELYDIFYADKPYAQEAAFIHDCLQTYSAGSCQRILELACGTGEHALALATLGYEILATDYSPDMLRCAEQKLAQKDTQGLQFQWQDMRDLKLPGQMFDAVICLFDAIGYVGTNQALEQVFQGVQRHLRPGGLFLFEFWHGAAMLQAYDPVRVRRWTTPTGQLLRLAETTLDPAAQLGQVNYSIYELRQDGTYTVLTETQTNRFFLMQEMAHWLTSSGFVPLKWFAGFDRQAPITQETWHIVALARQSTELSQFS